jgi:hypothetical protein
VYDRAQLEGVPFSAARQTQHTKGKNSVVMIKTGLQQCAGFEFGTVRAFMEVPVPGSIEEDDWLQFADVEWFKSPPAPHDMNTDINCPVMCKKFTSDPNGNFWGLPFIAATHVILAPHLQFSSYWQALHVDSDFLERDY